MVTFVVFIVSLGLLIFSFVMKSVEISRGRKIFLARLFERCDVLILAALLKIKYWWSQVNFKNTKLIFSWIIVRIRRVILVIKRRFDHKQSHFFTKRDHDASRSKGPVSSFLRNISEHKKKLREDKGE